MSHFARRICVLAICAWTAGCTEQSEQVAWPRLQVEAEQAQGAAGNPAPEPGKDAASAAFEEAEPLEDLMAQAPIPLGVELPEDLIIEKKIVGTDDRKRVANTRTKPYSTIATLIVQFPDGSRPGLCTGSLIASDAVLTAAHCVYSFKNGGWARSIRVIPGAFPNTAGVLQAPFGSASARRGFVPNAYQDASTFWAREPHDYGVVRIGAGLHGAPGVRAFGVMSSPRVGRAVTLAGYHGDKCAGTARCSPSSSSFVMHQSKDTIRELLPAQAKSFTLFNHYADSNGGASGAPLISDGAFADTIFAVHVAGFRDINANTWNMGVLLTPAAVTNIKSWARRAL
jgi:V8-like Glu-specific endopeptidase